MIPIVYARPTLIDSISPGEFLHWLCRWVADTVVALLTHPAAGKHSGHVGATDAYAVELADVRQALTDTDEFPVVDVTSTGFEPRSGVLDPEITRLFTDVDRLDADRTFPATLRAVGEWPDPTDIALGGGVRALDGA